MIHIAAAHFTQVGVIVEAATIFGSLPWIGVTHYIHILDPLHHSSWLLIFLTWLLRRNRFGGTALIVN